MPLLSAELPYGDDSAILFERLRDLPWPMFLDSGGSGRYDILCAAPYATLTTRGGTTEIAQDGAFRRSAGDPFALLREALGPATENTAGLPFIGGALGYFGYDLARRLAVLPNLAQDAEKLPEMAVGLYDWAVVVDHQARQARLASAGRHPATRAQWPALVQRLSQPSALAGAAPLRLAAPLASNLSRDAYAAAFARIQRYLEEGDCYQVNFAQRFAAPAHGDAWPLYRALRRANPAPFSAYLELPFVQVLSSSPERFLEARQGQVETRPIKGTRPRSADPDQDRALARELAASPKDRAENVMIVDLLRNDLGKVCKTGSVRVPRLFEVESFATVHHLVSTVTGRLAHGRHALDLLRACFPGGSVTGAPKQRAMEIIEELEPHRRGIYCGAIGYVGFDGAMDTNIAIRTLVHGNGELRFWAGGGIVRDSDEEEEYRETFHKAAALLRLFGAPVAPSGRMA